MEITGGLPKMSEANAFVTVLLREFERDGDKVYSGGEMEEVK